MGALTASVRGHGSFKSQSLCALPASFGRRGSNTRGGLALKASR